MHAELSHCLRTGGEPEPQQQAAWGQLRCLVHTPALSRAKAFWNSRSARSAFARCPMVARSLKTLRSHTRGEAL